MTPQERTAAHCKRIGIDPKRFYLALRQMGRKELNKSEMEWSIDNPTRNYCYVVTEWLYRYHLPDGSQPFYVNVPGDPYGHRFCTLFDGSIIDLTGEQFGEQQVPYWTAQPKGFMQTGGPQPSRRAQLLQHLYLGRPLATFVGKREQDWVYPDQLWRTPLTPLQHAQKLLSGWEDPYDTPILSQQTKATIGGLRRLTIVREDALLFGSKARFVDALVALRPEVQEWVFGSCPAQGWAQVSLTDVCDRHGKKAVYFMAQRSMSKLTAEQKAGLQLGGDYHWVPNGMLPVTQARAREYVEEKPDTRALLPIGLEHPLVFAAIIKAASAIGSPKEVWSVASSGTLSRGMQMAWPKAKVHAVSVGHAMNEREIGRAQLWRSPYKFTDRVSAEHVPPYPSVMNYDAKVWHIAAENANDGAWIWNVAADLPEDA